MPFKSKAQQRFMFAAEERGDVPKGTAMEWAHKTKDFSRLPEKKTASDLALEVLAACQTPGEKIRSGGRGRGLAVGGGKGPIGRRGMLSNFDEDESSCLTPGEKIRSKGTGRGLGMGRGRGPMGIPAGIKSWETLKNESEKKTASDLANAVLATDGRSSSVMHDFYEGGKWAPGGIEYQGPMKIAAELPTNVADRAPMAIGSIIGAPKMKPPKFPSMPKVKKLASEIAELVLQKVAAHGR